MKNLNLKLKLNKILRYKFQDYLLIINIKRNLKLLISPFYLPLH